MLDLHALLGLWLARERDGGARKARDRETLQFFEGRVAVPLPEMDRNERTAIANLMAQGIVAQANRIASTQPTPRFPDGTTKSSHDRARKKRKAMMGMWDENMLDLKDQQRARWLMAYASSPVLIRPSWSGTQWSVRWELRSPLSTYPAPTPSHLDMTPPDVIFATTRLASALESEWTARAGALRVARGFDPSRPTDMSVTMLEFVSGDEYVAFVAGQQRESSMSLYSDEVVTREGQWAVELTRVPNRVGRCLAIVPNSVGLEQPMSKYEGMKGLYQQEARLNALQYRAIANDVDPALWFVENDQGSGSIVTPADGPAGVVGHVRGGALQNLHQTPGQLTFQMIDRLERAQRLEGGVPADLGGESGSNIRTARRGSELLAAVLDFPTQEAQMILAKSRKLEDDLAMDCCLEYYANETRSWGGFEFKPSDTFVKGEWHEVTYSLPGADANGLVIRVGQLVGTGLMSERTGRDLIPDIKDGEAEGDQVMFEQITKGLLAEFMQPDPTGQFNIVFKNRVAELVRDNKYDLVDAISAVQKEVQSQQATTTGTVEPGAPEAQPGIAPPGVGVEAATATPPANDLKGLSSLLSQLRSPQVFQTPQESVAAAGAGR